MRVPRSLWEATKPIRWIQTLQWALECVELGFKQASGPVSVMLRTSCKAEAGTQGSRLNSKDPIGDICVIET